MQIQIEEALSAQSVEPITFYSDGRCVSYKKFEKGIWAVPSRPSPSDIVTLSNPDVRDTLEEGCLTSEAQKIELEFVKDEELKLWVCDIDDGTPIARYLAARTVERGSLYLKEILNRPAVIKVSQPMIVDGCFEVFKNFYAFI